MSNTAWWQRWKQRRQQEKTSTQPEQELPQVTPLVTLSSLHSYAYCPKLAWYMLVAHETRDRNNAHLVEGSMLHKRADSAEKSVRRGVTQHRTMTLYSRKYGLSGLADLVEEYKGKIYPVEYKKGTDRKQINDRIQLCAQALCLEEMFQLEHPISRGFIFYAAQGRRTEIRLTKTLRKRTFAALDSLRAMLRSKECPDAAYSPKCHGCSYYKVCLPKETERIRHAQHRRSHKR